MKVFTLLFVIIFYSISFCQDFFRQFPDKALANRITKENFPYSDAVIILKEQSINMFPSTVSFRSSDIKGPSVITSKIIIAKLLNEASVKRYGNFEYEYNEPYGNDIPFVFDVKARVLKPSGNIEVVNQKDIKNIVSLERKDGTPLRRKVLFDIPNLAVEDIVQIEYEFHQPLSEKLGGTFYYNDRDYVIYSNAYLTLPVDATPSFNSFPQSKMPEPKVEQLSKNYGSGKTYFWSVQNLNSIPDEPFSFSFEDQSYLTAFTVRFRYNYLDEVYSWHSLGNYFFKEVVDRGSVSKGELSDLGLPKEIKKLDFGKVDSLYTKLKRDFKLLKYNSIYPGGVSSIIESKKGSPTDLSFLMYKILAKWDYTPRIILIRDKRHGKYESFVPTLEWFDRLALLVKVDSVEKVYDFDPSIQNNYENPWFLNSIQFFVVDEDKGFNKDFSFATTPDNNAVIEKHTLKISPDLTLNDSLTLKYCGANAENMRDEFYGSEEQSIKNYFREHLSASCFSKIDSLEINDIFNESSLVINSIGRPSASIDRVDTFLVIKLKNDIFRELRDKLFSAKRKGHILFDSPFKYQFCCSFHMPEGYAMKSSIGEHSFNTSFKGGFQIALNQKNDNVELTAELTFPIQQIAQGNYNELMNLIDNSIKLIEKDIILKRKVIKRT